MSKAEKALYAAVCLCAAALLIVLPIKLRAQRQQLTEMENQLAVSQAAWQATAEEKEGVLDQISAAETEKKEAAATLEEASARKMELQAQVDALRAEIDALKNAEASAP